jgi:hypothetical protein
MPFCGAATFTILLGFESPPRQVFGITGHYITVGGIVRRRFIAGLLILRRFHEAKRLIDVIAMLFDRTKLHEFRLWYHFGYFRYLPNLMQKIGIALPSCIRQRALLLHWPG